MGRGVVVLGVAGLAEAPLGVSAPPREGEASAASGAAEGGACGRGEGGGAKERRELDCVLGCVIVRAAQSVAASEVKKQKASRAERGKAEARRHDHPKFSLHGFLEALTVFLVIFNAHCGVQPACTSKGGETLKGLLPTCEPDNCHSQQAPVRPEELNLLRVLYNNASSERAKGLWQDASRRTKLHWAVGS